MRHRIIKGQLGRSYSLRKATLRDIARAVLIRQSVVTTRAKAKAARRLIERLLTLGKANSLSARRRAYAILNDHQLVKVLFNDIAPRYKNRTGGFTRIMHLLSRRGDAAKQVVLELTEKVIKEKIKKEKAKKKAETGPQPPEVKEEIPVSEEKPLPEPKPEIKEKPAPKKQKPGEKPKVFKPKPKETPPEPKAPEKPRKEEKQPGKKGIFGGLGRIFKKKGS